MQSYKIGVTFATMQRLLDSFFALQVLQRQQWDH